MGRAYVLGGRIFSPTESLTGRQDGWMVVQTSDIGLSDILAKRAVGQIASDEAVAQQLIVEAHRNDRYYRIIAGRLVEKDKKWNPKDAEANAEFFGDLSAPEEKSQLSAAFVEALTSFFLSAASLMGSPTASRVKAVASRARRNGSGVASTTSPDDMAGPTVPEPLTVSE